MKKTRVAIFDDNPDRRDSLQMLITAEPGMLCSGTFENCQRLNDCIEAAKPDVVLMDIDMPGINGIEAVKILRKHFPTLKIIMQTVFEDEDKITSAITAGADGYILKKASPHKITEAIKDVIEGGAPMTPSVAKYVLRVFQSQAIPKHEAEIQLSLREKEILNFLVEGLSYKMIATKCDISQFTVNAHIRKIYEKMQVHSVAEAVSKAIRDHLV